MSIEKVAVDPERTRQVVGLCLAARENETLIFSEKYVPPEKPFIDVIRDYSEETGDEAFLLNALF